MLSAAVVGESVKASDMGFWRLNKMVVYWYMLVTPTKTEVETELE